MKKNSRIKFNPVTKEIEVEGSESFVKTYFDKLQAMISRPSQVAAATETELKAVEASPEKKANKKPKIKKGSPVRKVPKESKMAKTHPPKKATKTMEKEPGVKRVTNIDMVVGLIQDNAEGISTAEIKGKTGLAESQIWGIVNRASKEGKIRKVKRGVYCGVTARQELKTK